VANGGVIETLLKDERCSDTVFLALTDDDSQEARIKAYTQGFYDILKKPVNPAELQLKASRWNKIAHMISLSQLKTELIELMVDDTLSPFGPVVQAADWLENAEAEVKRDDVAPIITAIENSSEGFLTQLGLLIEYTELVGGQTDLNLCAFSLQSILGAQYDRWRQICARNDLKFTMGKVEPDVQVFADSKILGRVLRWLCKDAVELAEQIAKMAPLAVYATKASSMTFVEHGESAAIADFKEIQTKLANTSDAEEGVASFNERRDPVFKGK
jgi:signal transduction histidine kinase